MKKTTVSLFFLICVLTKTFSQQDSSHIAQSFLPLLVMNFDAKVVSKNVQLQWEVSTNEDAKSFEIERAGDGFNFQKIGGKLPAAKQGQATYEFVDALPKKNLNLSYRVKIIGKDGSSVYSDVQTARIEDAELQCRLKQNPVHQSIEVEITSPTAGRLQAAVFSNYGQKLISESARLSSGTNLLSISSQDLLPGLHRLVLENGSERKVISFVKE